MQESAMNVKHGEQPLSDSKKSWPTTNKAETYWRDILCRRPTKPVVFKGLSQRRFQAMLSFHPVGKKLLKQVVKLRSVIEMEQMA